MEVELLAMLHASLIRKELFRSKKGSYETPKKNQMPISLSYTIYGYQMFSRLSNNIHALEDNKQRRDLFSNLSPRISRNITFTYLLNYEPGCHLYIILISRPGLRVFRSPAIFIFSAFTSCYNNPSCSIFSPNFLFFSF